MAKIHRKHEKIKTKHNNENRVNMNNKLEQLNETYEKNMVISHREQQTRTINDLFNEKTL